MLRKTVQYLQDVCDRKPDQEPRRQLKKLNAGDLQCPCWVGHWDGDHDEQEKEIEDQFAAESIPIYFLQKYFHPSCCLKLPNTTGTSWDYRLY